MREGEEGRGKRGGRIAESRTAASVMMMMMTETCFRESWEGEGKQNEKSVDVAACIRE